MGENKKKIIVAILNWGLGHASRCVPIIRGLLENNFTPVIASDGNALVFLKKEFPFLETLELPSYHIRYKKNLKLSIFLQLPKIWKTARKEQEYIQHFIIKDTNVVGIISDNRFGARSNLIPSVYLTHQINVLSGFFSFFASKIHQNIIQKYDECWIPDNANSPFSGKLSSVKSKKINAKYIGVLSRLKKTTHQKSIDILLLLSGPEPHRSLWEEKLKKIFYNNNRNVVLVRGKIENEQTKLVENKMTIFNFLLSKELQEKIQQSKIIICRSGYSSIMDLAVLESKAFFIPTKNQPEQEYLANYLRDNKYAPCCSEKNFVIEKLAEIEQYNGLRTEETILKSSLFHLFQSKRKF